MAKSQSPHFFPFLPLLGLAECPKPTGNQGSWEAKKPAVDQWPEGLQPHQGWFWQDPLCAAWMPNPSLLGPHTVEAGSGSLKAILSSERSLGAHQQGWARAVARGGDWRGSREGHLHGEGLGLRWPSAPKQQPRKVFKQWDPAPG